MNPLRRLFSENGISASPARTRAPEARRRARFRPLGEALEARRVLSTFRVNTLLDTVAVNLQTGKDASGHISLRSAIEAANSRPNSDTILLPNGTIKLTIAGQNEDNSAAGDLDINSKVTIKGKGAGKTIIDGNFLDRVFQVSAGNVQISGLTIQDGSADGGGGLLNSGGKVTLTSVAVANNVASGSNGANGLPGSGNSAFPSAGTGGGDGVNALGGGIFNQAGSLSLSKSTIVSNQAVGGAGGQGGDGGHGVGGTVGGDGRSVTGGAGGPGGSGGAPLAAAACTTRRGPASPFPPQRSFQTPPMVVKAATGAQAAAATAATELTPTAAAAAPVVTVTVAAEAKVVRLDRPREAASSIWAQSRSAASRQPGSPTQATVPSEAGAAMAAADLPAVAAMAHERNRRR